MTYLERKEKEIHLLCLIKKGALFCLDKVAEDYNCSKRTVERMIKDLKLEGYNITFCRKSNKYIIEN